MITSGTGTTAQGSIWAAIDLVLPGEMELRAEKHSANWSSLPTAEGHSFDRQLRALGWSCFFIAGELKTFRFGYSRTAMLKSAVRGLLAQVRALHYNCAEMGYITSARFLGIPYLIVHGHAMHIQHGCQLDASAQRKQWQKASEWARE